MKANSQILGASTSLRRLQVSTSNFHIFLKFIHRRSPFQLSIWFRDSQSSSGRSWLAYHMLRSLSKTYERRLDWIPGLLREEAKIKTDILGLNIWDIWEYMEIYGKANWFYRMVNLPNSKSVVHISSYSPPCWLYPRQRDFCLLQQWPELQRVRHNCVPSWSQDQHYIFISGGIFTLELQDQHQIFI